jgi:hypothetical protein
MTPKKHARRAIEHQPPPSAFLTDERLANAEFMRYRKEVHVDLKPTNKRQHELVDRFVDLAWHRKELEEQLSELLNSPMASAQRAFDLKAELEEALEQIVMIARTLSQMQNEPILLVIPKFEPGVEALPVASMHLQ